MGWKKGKDASSENGGPRYEACDPRVISLVEDYILRLGLPVDRMQVTSDRRVYSRWLGRRIPSAYGGAYCFLRRPGIHAILINLDRIDLTKPRSLEVVVAEELIHMRDRLDGDERGHAKHGYDRIAVKVGEITGATLEEIHSALIPAKQRPYRYIYSCPRCGIRIPRKRTGRWSCPRCSSSFDPRFVLRIVEHLEP